MKRRYWDSTLTTYGWWWLNVQCGMHPQLGAFRGIKVGPLAVYFRWSLPKPRVSVVSAERATKDEAA